MKNRNAPQVRLLRNDTDNGNHSVAIQLIGRQSNRDAVGAVVTLATATGRRTKQVTLGSGFLSQSTKWLHFGLGGVERIDRAVIHWPSGLEQTLVNLPIDHRITLVEGEEDFTAVPFALRPRDPKVCAPPKRLPLAAPSEGIAMLDPVPFPPYPLESLAGKIITPAKVKGRATLLNFWATWCAPCQTEMKLWKQHYEDIRAAGADVLAISVDSPQDRAKVEQFVRERALPFPVLLMNPDILERVNLFYRLLFTRSTDLQLPTTFLLNSQGKVAKLYLGVVPMKVLLKDLQDVQNNPQRLTRSAFPYTGRTVATEFGRDYYAMGLNFIERDMLEEGALYLRQAVESFPSEARSWNQLGLVYARLGQLEQSLTALQHAVQLQPNFANSQFDLGVTYLRLNRLVEAEQAIARATTLDPADPRKRLTYQLTLAQMGKGGDPVEILKRYLAEEPADAEAQNNLGAFYTGQGLFRMALEQFKKATELDPHFARALRNLGVTYLRLQMPSQAAASLERCVTLTPDDPEALFALAFAYGQTGRQEKAIQVLERVLELQPEHPRAREFLQQLRQTR